MKEVEFFTNLTAAALALRKGYRRTRTAIGWKIILFPMASQEDLLIGSILPSSSASPQLLAVFLYWDLHLVLALPLFFPLYRYYGLLWSTYKNKFCN